MDIFVGLVDNGPKYKMLSDDLRKEVTDQKYFTFNF